MLTLKCPAASRKSASVRPPVGVRQLNVWRPLRIVSVFSRLSPSTRHAVRIRNDCAHLLDGAGVNSSKHPCQAIRNEKGQLSALSLRRWLESSFARTDQRAICIRQAPIHGAALRHSDRRTAAAVGRAVRQNMRQKVHARSATLYRISWKRIRGVALGRSCTISFANERIRIRVPWEL